MTDEWKAYDFAGIYAIRHIEDGKVYVGQSQKIGKRIHGHKCKASNCHHVSRAIKKYGWEAFEIIILERVDDLELLTEREQHWIDVLNACDPEYGYNVAPVAGSCRGIKRSDETRDKIRLANLGKHLTVEHRISISAASKGKPHSAEHTAKASAARRNPSAETRAKIGAVHLGLRHTEEAKAKMSAASKGRQPSDETRAKISAAGIGRKHSEEAKAKISEGHKGKPKSAEWRAKIAATLQGKPLSEERVAKLREVLGSPEEREANRTRNLERCHSTERTAIVLDYLEKHPDASLSAITRATGVGVSGVHRLLLRAGWHYVRGAGWQKITPPE